jgi:hypothetical protein
VLAAEGEGAAAVAGATAAVAAAAAEFPGADGEVKDDLHMASQSTAYYSPSQFPTSPTPRLDARSLRRARRQQFDSPHTVFSDDSDIPSRRQQEFLLTPGNSAEPFSVPVAKSKSSRVTRMRRRRVVLSSSGSEDRNPRRKRRAVPPPSVDNSDDGLSVR